MASTACAMRLGALSAPSINLHPRQYAPHQSIAVLNLNRNTPSGLRSIRSKGRITCSVATPSPPTLPPAISLSEKALAHIKRMRNESGKDLTLRVGVRQGGCSGMSYVMEFEERANIREEDSLIDQEDFTMVCDPKSLLYLFGMQLDYSDALIGGGFSFQNPNASSTCGCGKSFAA
ncbi:Iron-sulphur cluster biosynthesis family protein [Klebsormidium nitens]|uniref:Iron-sulphur cluster biosynthesis family protein n=1 Tax=Klebsormidium nitens TaxID=105231 RepID=A0A1Y1IKA4_KLENI|nr:Iron-sulphur cluster biosynthesis family protein [Klebsormidium nitens]|eukprot:GAQ89196.1 Iron-sulphur cluster biosynthesis family protein [Klebsormidium nitens]